MGIAGVGFVPDFVAETEIVIEASGIVLDSQAAKVLRGTGFVPYFGDAAGFIMDFSKEYSNGGDAVDCVTSVAWNSLTFGVGFIPYVGPLLSFGLEVGNYLSGGQWEAGFEGAVEDGLRSLGG